METIEIIPESIELIRMSDEEYFNNYKDYISNSGLGLLNPEQGGSLENYLEGFQSKYSESFELGGAVHAMLLQPDDYEISPLSKPSGKLGMFVNRIYELRKEGYKINDAIQQAKFDSDYYSSSLTENRIKTAIKKSIQYYLDRLHSTDVSEKQVIYLSDAMRLKYNSCMESLNADKKLLSILRPKGFSAEDVEIFNECAILCSIKVTVDDEEIILKVKSKLDNFTINHVLQTITLNDLKTTGKPAKFFMGNYIWDFNEDGDKTKKWIDGSFQKYHYFRQIAMYLWLLSLYFKYNYSYSYSLSANMLIVETIPNFQTRVAKVNSQYIQRGLGDFKELIVILARWMMQQKKR